MTNSMIAQKENVKNAIKKKIRKKILLFVLGKVWPVILIVLLIYLLPYIVSYEMRESFDEWYTTHQTEYADTDAAVSAWIDTLTDEIPLGDGFVKREEVKEFINQQYNTYLHDTEIDITEKTETTFTDSKYGRSNTTNSEKKIPYKLNLTTPTYEYRVPWQTMLIIAMSTYDDYTDVLKKNILEYFSPKFYGLIGDDTKEVTQKDIKTGADFNYKKKVDVVTKEVTKYTEKEPDYTDETGARRTGRTHHYTRTKVIHSYSEYPLPYFSKIEGLTLNSNMTYDEKSTTDTDTTVSRDGKTTTTVTVNIKEPILISNKNVESGQKFLAGMKKLDVSTEKEDIEFMSEQAEVLPNGTFAKYIFDTLARISAGGIDLYSGIGSNGKMKLSGTGIMSWPISGPVNITSGYGMRFHPVLQTNRMHTGIDIAADTSMSVFAAADGTVDYASTMDGYGNLLIINHGGGITTYYAHLSSMNVKVGDKVQKGKVIAVPGNTGVGTGVHLHFEVRENGNPIDPAGYLGLIPDYPEIRIAELKYSDVNKEKLVDYLNMKNSYFATSARHIDAIISGAKIRDLDPLLLFSITGAEMGFVKNDPQYWDDMYAGFLLSNLHHVDPSLQIKDAPRIIANNPFNVYHTWWEYNTTIEESARVAANTVANSLSDCPEGRNPLVWVNVRDGTMGYAEDLNWAGNVSRIYEEIKAYVR